MEPNTPDKRALRTLLKYDVYATGAYEPESLGGLSAEDFEHGISEGVLFRPGQLEFSHDELVDWVVEQHGRTTPKQQSDFFLASLSTGRLDYRAGLAAYALSRHVSFHEFQPLSGNPYCQVCGHTRQKNSVHRTLSNQARFVVGGFAATPMLGDMAFYLERQNELTPVEPTSADLEIFTEILAILSDADPDETAKKSIVRRIRKIPGLKSSVNQTQSSLETLGFCGILESKEHGGLLDRFVRLSNAPAKTHSSDWAYPVDFWTGKDGLNTQALAFWFGEYSALAQFTS